VTEHQDDIPGPEDTTEEAISPAPSVGSTSDSLIGTKIGSCTLKRLIGSGGMGTVYEAMQEQPHRRVALKMMKQGITSRSAKRRFEFESQTLARLKHQGVAQIHEAGTHDDGSGGVPYFVMEYIPNAKSITDYANGKQLGIRERLTLFTKVCDAVQHGHLKGIIHRDLKPGNILVDSNGQPRIIDFGIARSTDSDLAVTTLQTDVGQLMGTMQYMSPEQCEADPSDIDTRSDVYALGVILYELLTGKPPYNIKQVAIHEAVRIVREEQPTKLSTIDRHLRGDIETIALKALEKERDRRYQSAGGLQEDINRYLAGDSITASPPSLWRQLGRIAKKHKVASTVFGTIIPAIIVIGVFTMNFQRNMAREEARTLQAEIQVFEEQERSRELATAMDIAADFTTDMIMGAQLTDVATELDIPLKRFLNAWLTKTVETARSHFTEGDEQSQRALANVLLQSGFGYFANNESENAGDLMLEGVSIHHQLNGSDHEAWVNTRGVAPAMVLLQGAAGSYEFNLDDLEQTHLSELWLDAKPHFSIESDEIADTVWAVISTRTKEDTRSKQQIELQKAFIGFLVVQAFDKDQTAQSAKMMKAVTGVMESDPRILEACVKTVELLGLDYPRAGGIELIAILIDGIHLFVQAAQDAISSGANLWETSVGEILKADQGIDLFVRVGAWAHHCDTQSVVDSLNSSSFSAAWRNLLAILSNEGLIRLSRKYEQNPELHTEEEWTALLETYTGLSIEEAAAIDFDALISDLGVAWRESVSDPEFRTAFNGIFSPLTKIGIIMGYSSWDESDNSGVWSFELTETFYKSLNFDESLLTSDPVVPE